MACSSKQREIDNVKANFDWLCDNWVNNQDSTVIFFENWHKVDDKNYDGISYILSKKDTVFFESIKLLISDTGTYYSVRVRNQNNGNAINFKLISSKNNNYIFENKKHDFPQRIGYNQVNSDTLHAWIEGFSKGKNKKEKFLMWRNK